MTNQDVLMAAIEFEEMEFALDLLYLIQMGIVDPNAEYQDLGETWNKVDKSIVNEWQQQNLLNFDIINIYCIRLNVDDHEIFFARNIEDARGYALQKYRFIPKIVQMDKSKYLKEFYFEDSGQYKSLRDIKNESNVFPRQAFIM